MPFKIESNFNFSSISDFISSGYYSFLKKVEITDKTLGVVLPILALIRLESDDPLLDWLIEKLKTVRSIKTIKSIPLLMGQSERTSIKGFNSGYIGLVKKNCFKVVAILSINELIGRIGLPSFPIIVIAEVPIKLFFLIIGTSCSLVENNMKLYFNGKNIQKVKDKRCSLEKFTSIELFLKKRKKIQKLQRSRNPTFLEKARTISSMDREAFLKHQIEKYESQQAIMEVQQTRIWISIAVDVSKCAGYSLGIGKAYFGTRLVMQVLCFESETSFKRFSEGVSLVSGGLGFGKLIFDKMTRKNN